MWGLVIMLTPASALLLTVIVLPALQRQWRIGLYTLGVALLGFWTYALLQLLRRLQLVAFCQNASLSTERWPTLWLAVALAALPGFLTGILLHFATGISALSAACTGAASACLALGILTLALSRMLRRTDTYACTSDDRTALLNIQNIPHDGQAAPPALAVQTAEAAADCQFEEEQSAV